MTIRTPLTPTAADAGIVVGASPKFFSRLLSGQILADRSFDRRLRLPRIVFCPPTSSTVPSQTSLVIVIAVIVIGHRQRFSSYLTNSSHFRPPFLLLTQPSPSPSCRGAFLTLVRRLLNCCSSDPVTLPPSRSADLSGRIPAISGHPIGF